MNYDKVIGKGVRICLALGKSMPEVEKMTPMQINKFINGFDKSKLTLRQVILISKIVEEDSLLFKIKKWLKLK